MWESTHPCRPTVWYYVQTRAHRVGVGDHSMRGSLGPKPSDAMPSFSKLGIVEISFVNLKLLDCACTVHYILVPNRAEIVFFGLCRREKIKQNRKGFGAKRYD